MAYFKGTSLSVTSFEMATYTGVARFLSLLALLGAGCTVGSAQTEQGSPWDGATDGGGSGSSSGGSSSGSSSGFGGGDASACQPGDVGTYRPGSYRLASGAGQGACIAGASGDPIAGFFDACLGPSATTDKCNTFRSANSTCVSCILTPESAPKYGPLIEHGGFVTVNVAGCIELADPGALACAKAVQALAGCELAACEANCPVHDSDSLTAYEACATNAETGGCDTYATAATCALTEPDAVADTAACLGDFQTFYTNVVPRFCGPADAGVGAPFDASADAAEQ
jgi:hypothetical protein